MIKMSHVGVWGKGWGWIVGAEAGGSFPNHMSSFVKLENEEAFLVFVFFGLPVFWLLSPCKSTNVVLRAYWTRRTVLLFYQQFPRGAVEPSHYLLNAEEFSSETWILGISNEMWKLPLCFGRCLAIAICPSVQWPMWNVFLAHLSPEKNNLKKYKHCMCLFINQKTVKSTWQDSVIMKITNDKTLRHPKVWASKYSLQALSSPTEMSKDERSNWLFSNIVW